MRFIRFIKETTFVVTRKEKTVISMPTVVFALLMLFFWQFLIPHFFINKFIDLLLKHLRNFFMWITFRNTSRFHKNSHPFSLPLIPKLIIIMPNAFVINISIYSSYHRRRKLRFCSGKQKMKALSHILLMKSFPMFVPICMDFVIQDVQQRTRYTTPMSCRH